MNQPQSVSIEQVQNQIFKACGSIQSAVTFLGDQLIALQKQFEALQKEKVADAPKAEEPK